jgi:hypothetical protein
MPFVAGSGEPVRCSRCLSVDPKTAFIQRSFAVVSSPGARFLGRHFAKLAPNIYEPSESRFIPNPVRGLPSRMQLPHKPNEIGINSKGRPVGRLLRLSF